MRADLLPLYESHVAGLLARTRSALDAAGRDELVIHSGSLIKRSIFDDQYWPLRLVPHFQHWAHMPWPDQLIQVRQGGRPRLLWFRDRSFWERLPEVDFDAFARVFDLVEVKGPEGLMDALGAVGPRAVFVGEDHARASALGFTAEAVNPGALMASLDELRVHKSAFELACLREANRIAAAGHGAVRDAFLAGERSELALHLLYLEATGQDDPETPYKNIVALGDNAAILHHVHYVRSPRREARSLLLDAGASYLGYASDITRTVPIAGASSAGALFASLVAGVEKLQQAMVREVALGRPYEQLHDASHARVGELLASTGVVRSSGEAAVETGVTRKFFPHGLGHSLGLQTHDVGCAKVKPRPENPWLRNTRAIEAGQVFTIEPGLYFIDTLMDELRASPAGASVDWDKVEALRPFGGIRIEDDVAVAAGGPSNLTREVLPS